MNANNQLLIIFVLLTLLFYYLWRRSSKKLQDVRYQKHSLSTKYGKITEQFLPILDIFPYDKSGFRFIGTPIDGIQFDDDKIVFLEFKCASSRLNQRQTNIKRLIAEKRIFFEEIHLT